MHVYVLTRNMYFPKLLGKSISHDCQYHFFTSPHNLFSALEEHEAPFCVLVDSGYGVEAIMGVYIKYNGMKNFGRLFVVNECVAESGSISSENISMVTHEDLDGCLDSYLSIADGAVGEKDADYICGSSEVIRNLKSQIERVGKADCDVIVYGETGSGKELVARQIARYRPGRIVFVNCARLSSDLAESLIFGHKLGSFTSAWNEKPGLVEDADGATLILDEFEELPQDVQAKLLRFAENREFRRLGDNKLRHSSCRIVAVTNRTISDLLKSNRLRLDLYMRLGQEVITTPSLNENKEDIEELVRFYEKKKGYKKPIRDIEGLKAYSWPGNVRELFTAVDRIHRNGNEDKDLTLKDLCPVDLFGKKDKS